MSCLQGTLWVVATPIGNLGDISARAAQVLAQCDLVAAEDTRHSQRLLAHLGLSVSLLSVHEHNEHERVEKLLARLDEGQQIGLISDAGTPLISDPGYSLVKAVRQAGHTVMAVPGPCAAIVALSVAGLPTDRFVFEGFLPAKSYARHRRLQALAGETRTLVCYESSHRIRDTARDLAAVLGERTLVLARELTKRHEQSITLAARELPDWLSADANRCRGEFVLVIAGHNPVPEQADEHMVALDQLLGELLAVTGTKQAAKMASRLTGVARNTAYARALALSSA